MREEGVAYEDIGAKLDRTGLSCRIRMHVLRKAEREGTAPVRHRPSHGYRASRTQCRPAQRSRPREILPSAPKVSQAAEDELNQLGLVAGMSFCRLTLLHRNYNCADGIVALQFHVSKRKRLKRLKRWHRWPS